MRGWRYALLGLLTLSLTAAELSADVDLFGAGGVGPAPPSGNTVTHSFDLIAYACTIGQGGICIGYDGVTPGPTMVTHVGDTLEVTVTNRVPETIANLSGASDLKARLAAASISLHTHGVTITPDNDGIGAHAGTNFIDSSVAPNATRVYTLQTLHAGAWHYHDHMLGPDGAEGQERGLYGSLYVLETGESTTTFDLHLLDNGDNSGQGLNGTVDAGDRFDLLIAGLGDKWWDVKLYDPADALIRETTVGPGVSDVFRVDSAALGDYRWTAKSILATGTRTGVIEAL